MKKHLLSLITLLSVIFSQQAFAQCEAGFTWEQLPGTLTIHFNNTSESLNDIISYQWIFGDGHNGDGENPNHTYSAPGTYNVCLIIEDNEGCIEDVCHMVTVAPLSDGCEAAFTWEQIDGTLTIHFNNNSTSEFDIISNQWSFGDGDMGDGVNPNHTYDEPGTYLVCLTIEDGMGCEDDVCHEVVVEEVGGGCEANFTWEQIDGTLTIHFTNTSTSEHDIISYSWNFGDSHMGDGQNPNHTYPEAGEYVVCLIIEDEVGCVSDVCHEITVEAPTGCEADFTWDQGNGLVVHFFDQSDDDPDIVSWSWNFGDGHESDDQNPVHEYDEPGVYVVCLIVENEFGCVSDVCHEVVVEGGNGECEAAFAWDQGNGLIVHFIDQSDDDPDIVSWNWTFGDGHGSDDQNPVHEYDEPGVYVVCLIVENEFGCVSDICHEVVVEGGNGECEAAFVWEQGNGLIVHFIDQSDPDIVSWNWTFGDGHGSDDQNPVHEYDDPGVYVVCLIVENEFGCVSDVCHEVVVEGGNGECEAAFTWEQGNGLNVHFFDQSDDDPDIVTWQWNFGDGHMGDGQNPVHEYAEPGVYVVCLIVTNEFGCVSDVCHEVVVEEGGGGCEAGFTWDQGSGLTVYFFDQSDDNPDIVSWQWNFGDGHTSDDQNPVHEYAEPGAYLVCLIVVNEFGCTSDVCHEVVIELSQGECEAEFTWEQGNGLSIHFIDQSDDNPDIISYHWIFGDGHHGDGQNPVHEYDEPGVYLVCLLIENEFGCTSDVCHEVVVEGEAEGCHASFIWEGVDGTLTVHFQSTSTSEHDIVSYQWNFGDGHTGDGINPHHTYEEPGVYVVCLLITDNAGCTSDVCHEVVVGEGGGGCEADFTWEHGENLTIHFIDQSDDDPDIVTWQWNFGDGHNGDGQNPVHHYDEPGVYVVCLIITNEIGCVSDVCHEVVVEEEECNASFSFETSDNGEIVFFHNTSTGDSDHTVWLWEFGDGHTSHEEHPDHNYEEPGIYTVCLTMSDTVTECFDEHCIELMYELGFQDLHSNFYFASARESEKLPQSLNEDFILIGFNNPASEEINLRYTLGEVTDVTIELYDLTGNKLVSEKYTAESKGGHQKTIHAGHLMPGLYIINLSSAQERYTRAITISR